MLLFESVSAGGIAVLAAILAILLLVGVYSELVWPYTKWDLASLDPGTSQHYLEYLLGAVFAAGSALGFWSFSGAAFRGHGSRHHSSALAPRPVAPVRK
jgi:hypothetical protein